MKDRYEWVSWEDFESKFGHMSEEIKSEIITVMFTHQVERRLAEQEKQRKKNIIS